VNKIPKIAHFYWEGEGFSYLHYLSVRSFTKKNPDWTVKVHVNKEDISSFQIPWATNEQKEKYTGKNYFNKLKELDLEIHEFDFTKLGVNPEAHPVLKSDILRWYLLASEGGAWVDSDIIHLKPLSSLQEKIEPETDVVNVFNKDHYIIGFLMSSPSNKYFFNLFELASQVRGVDYQMFGNRLQMHLKQIGVLDSLSSEMNFHNLYVDSFYKYKWTDVNLIFNQSDESFKDDDVIGVHWFNGDNTSTKFCNKFDEFFEIVEGRTTIESIIHHEDRS